MNGKYSMPLIQTSSHKHQNSVGNGLSKLKQYTRHILHKWLTQRLTGGK